MSREGSGFPKSPDRNLTLIKTISIYTDDGKIFKENLDIEINIQNYVTAINKEGYFHKEGNFIDYYPPFRIIKIRLD